MPLVVQRVGSMLTPYFARGPVTDLAAVTATDRARWVRFFHGMRARGVHLPPSPYEAWFLSTAHDASAIARALAAAEGALGDS